MPDNKKNNNDELDEIKNIIGHDDGDDSISIDELLKQYGTAAEPDETENYEELPPEVLEVLREDTPSEYFEPPAEEQLPPSAAAELKGKKHGRRKKGAQPEPEPEPELAPQPEINAENDVISVVDRRREELRKAKRHSNELQNEIASSVDAAMNEKKPIEGMNDIIEPSRDQFVTGEDAFESEPEPEYIPAAPAPNYTRVSDDLRTFRNNRPDEAAAKAKRAMGYYSWRCTAVFLLAILSWYMTTAATYQWWQPAFLSYIESPFIFLLLLSVIQIVAMFISISLIADGLLSIIRLNFKGETLIALSCFVNLLYTISIIIFPKWGGFLPCVPAALIGLAVGLYTRYQRYKGVRWSCRAAARAEGRYCAIKGMRDKDGEVKTVYKTEPRVLRKDFMEKLLEEDRSEQLMHYAVPITLIVTILFAVISSVGLGTPERFLWHWSTLLSVCVPCGLILSRVIPYTSVSGKLSRIGVAIIGTSGLRDLSNTDAAIVRETDIFPTKMVTVNSVKPFSGFTREKVNLCTLSLLKASGSSLYDAFAASLTGQPMSLPAVEEFEFFETGGIGAYVNGEKVLVGTASFILRMGVRIPEGINLKNGVFVAINLQFAGLFSIKYDVQPSVRRSMNYLVKHKIAPVIAVRDFNINEQLIESRFKISADNIGYPELEERIAYSAIKDTEMDEDCAVVAINNLHSYGEAVICGKRIKSAEKLNIVFGLMSLCLGVALIFYLLFMEAFTVATPANIFYYMLLWLLPVFLSSLGANRR